MSIFQKTFVILHNRSKKCKAFALSNQIQLFKKQHHEDIT